MSRNRFLFCDWLDRAYFYKSLRTAEVGGCPNSSAVTLCDHCERVHCSAYCNASDKVRAVDADKDPVYNRRIVQVDFAVPSPLFAVHKRKFCTFNINGTAANEGHDLEGFPIPFHALNGPIPQLSIEVLHDLRNVTGILEDFALSYTDGVTDCVTESIEKRGVYILENGDSVHRFFDDFSHLIPLVIAVLHALQNESPDSFNLFSNSTHNDFLPLNSHFDCNEAHK